MSGTFIVLRLPPEEISNTLTHGVGWLLSTIGAAVMMARVLETGDPWRIVGCAIFASVLVFVYAVSTLSHAVVSSTPRRWFRMLDQGFIYILIVATYTPFAVTYLRTPWWWIYFAFLWGIALAGLISKLMFGRRIDAVTLRSYVVLGWLPAFPMASLIGTIDTACLAWVLAGGLCYTTGTLFFMWDNSRYHSHAFWHVMAMAGSVCHFLAIYWFVAAPGVGI